MSTAGTVVIGDATPECAPESQQAIGVPEMSSRRLLPSQDTPILDAVSVGLDGGPVKAANVISATEGALGSDTYFALCHEVERMVALRAEMERVGHDELFLVCDKLVRAIELGDRSAEREAAMELRERLELILSQEQLRFLVSFEKTLPGELAYLLLADGLAAKAVAAGTRRLTQAEGLLPPAPLFSAAARAIGGPEQGGGEIWMSLLRRLDESDSTVPERLAEACRQMGEDRRAAQREEAEREKNDVDVTRLAAALAQLMSQLGNDPIAADAIRACLEQLTQRQIFDAAFFEIAAAFMRDSLIAHRGRHEHHDGRVFSG